MSERGLQGARRRPRRDTATPDGARIRLELDGRDLTQEQFALGKGFTLRTLQRALAGTRITKSALREIARALSLSYEEVVAARPAGPADRSSAAEPPPAPAGELVRIANALRLQFHRATEYARPPLDRSDLAEVLKSIETLRQLDPNNGYAHYYAGEAKRWMGLREASHRDFYRYLSYFENSLFAGETPAVDLEASYRRGHGYCSERTAWIHHLLAFDLWSSRRCKRDLGLLQHALHHAEAALAHHPGGFVQHLSTKRMRDAIGQCMAKLNGAPATEHPP
jgi:hypothetical protein